MGAPASPESSFAGRLGTLQKKLDALVPGEYSQAAVVRRLGTAAMTPRAGELGRMRPRKRMGSQLGWILGFSLEEFGVVGTSMDDQAIA